MLKKSCKKSGKNRRLAGIKAFPLNLTIPIEDVFTESAKYQRELGVKEIRSIDTYYSRTNGEDFKGPGLVACKASDIHIGNDINLTTLKLTNKNIDQIGDTPARRNGIKTAIRQAIIDCNELGILSVPDSDLKGLRLEDTRPPEPVSFTEDIVEYIRRSKKGQTTFEASRNDIYYDLELLRGIRPGLEIINIDNEDVHAEDNYIEFARKDGVMDRAYIRRDLSDKIMLYQKMRKQIIKNAHVRGIRAFFILEEPRRDIKKSVEENWRMTSYDLTTEYGKLRKAAAPLLNDVRNYSFRATGVSNHHERGQDLGIWGDKLCYEDNHDPQNSLAYYQKKINEHREFTDRYPSELIVFCESWIFESFRMFLKRPCEIRHLFAMIALGIILGKTQVRILLQEYRCRKRELPPQSMGQRIIERYLSGSFGSLLRELNVLFTSILVSENTHEHVE
jgi:hypothetical protein